MTVHMHAPLSQETVSVKLVNLNPNFSFCSPSWPAASADSVCNHKYSIKDAILQKVFFLESSPAAPLKTSIFSILESSY